MDVQNNNTDEQFKGKIYDNQVINGVELVINKCIMKQSCTLGFRIQRTVKWTVPRQNSKTQK